MTDLDNDEIFRYGRQLILPEFGILSQRKLKASSALIVGCGGLGCPAAIYLAGAGIGTLGLLDHDTVEVNNLHRQILHREAPLIHKADSAQLACYQLNSRTKYLLHKTALNSENAREIIAQYDVVLDCTDNVATRYLINDVCILENKPLVSGAAIRFEGQLTVYGHSGGPCYRCVYPQPPPPHAVTSCGEAGVLGPIPGVIGTMQAQEAIKVITSIGDVLSGRLFMYDGLSFQTRVIKLRPRQPSCAVCGDTPTITQPIDYVQFCGSAASDKVSNKGDVATSRRRITPDQYQSDYLKGGVEHVLVDTRPPGQLEICRLANSTNIPLKTLLAFDQSKIEQLLSSSGNPKSIVVVCQHGNDSQVAAHHLVDILANTHGNSDTTSPEVVDIRGGLDAWSQTVDKGFPRY